MSLDIDFSEVQKVADRIGLEPAQAVKHLRAAAVTVGRQATARAKQAAPKDRPWLATSGIRQKTWSDRNGAHTDIFTVPDPEGRPVGFFVEYGTSDTPPQPFLTPQVAWAEPELHAEVLRRIDPLGEGSE